VILSHRTAFIGFHLTVPMRDKLRKEAKEHGMSVSMYIYSLVRKHLGYEDIDSEELIVRP
jgi:hypothetical protein